MQPPTDLYPITDNPTRQQVRDELQCLESGLNRSSHTAIAFNHRYTQVADSIKYAPKQKIRSSDLPTEACTASPYTSNFAYEVRCTQLYLELGFITSTWNTVELLFECGSLAPPAVASKLIDERESRLVK